MGKQRMRAMMGSALLIVAAILLIATIFMSWYTVTATFNGSSASIDFHPNNQVVLAVAGATVTEGYSSGTLNLNNTGNLYALVEGLVIGGLVLALLAGTFGMLMSSRPNMRRPAIICGILALVLALAGPIALAVAQPGALNSDSHSGFLAGSNNSVGPTSSFTGSANVGGASETWGPAVGFYLAIIAGVLALVGAAMLMMAHPERDAVAGAWSNQCAQCGASFSTPEELANHAAAAHPPVQPPAMPPGA